MAEKQEPTYFSNAELGYVKIFRSLIYWKWYKDPYATRVFLHCLLNATAKHYYTKAHVLKRGTFWTTRRYLAQALDISEYHVRKAIEKLVSSNAISCKNTPYGTYISIVNWNFYQCEALGAAQQRRQNGWHL